MTAELAVFAADPAVRDAATPDDVAVLVTTALIECRSLLATAMRGTDPTPVGEFKAWAAVALEAVRQKQLGGEIRLDALEMVRRAERGLGVAIRNGQAAGEIETNAEARARGGRGRQQSGVSTLLKPRPMDYASKAELFGASAGHPGAFYLADGVTDEQFEAVIAQARAESNLSRANIVRKLPAKRAKPAAVPQPVDTAPKTRRRFNSNRIIETAVTAAEPSPLLEFVNYAALDRGRIDEWVNSLATSIRSLQSIKKQLEKELTHVAA